MKVRITIPVLAVSALVLITSNAKAESGWGYGH